MKTLCGLILFAIFLYQTDIAQACGSAFKESKQCNQDLRGMGGSPVGGDRGVEKAPRDAGRVSGAEGEKVKAKAAECEKAAQACIAKCTKPADRAKKQACERQHKPDAAKAAKAGDAMKQGGENGGKTADSGKEEKKPEGGGGGAPPPPGGKPEQQAQQPPAKKDVKKTAQQLCEEAGKNWMKIGGEYRCVVVGKGTTTVNRINEGGGSRDSDPSKGAVVALSGNDSVIEVNPINPGTYWVKKSAVRAPDRSIASVGPAITYATAKAIAPDAVQADGAEGVEDKESLKISKEDLAKAILHPSNTKEASVSLDVKTAFIKDLIVAKDFCAAGAYIKALASGDVESQSEAKALRESLDQQLGANDSPIGDFGVELLCNLE